MQKIAIIIPCYNEQNRFNEANIETLLSQTAVDIYLANDGSTDKALQKSLQFQIKMSLDVL